MSGKLLASVPLSTLARRSMAYTVKHNQTTKVFSIDLGNNEEAVVTYERRPDGVVDLQHTIVPDTHRGKGIAKILAKDVMDHFVAEKVKMRLSCWYLQKYFNENPTDDYKSLVVKS